MATNPWAKPAAPEETPTAPVDEIQAPVDAIPPLQDGETAATVEEIPSAPATTEETLQESTETEISTTATADTAPAPVIDVPVVAPAQIDSSKVTVVIPKSFNLTLDDRTVVAYKAGTQNIPREHAEHWYAKANGVTIFTGE